MRKAAVCLIGWLIPVSACLAGENWPHWRGPSLDGTSDSTQLPVSWSEGKNIRWKTPLPSYSAATPAIWGDRIFVMSGSPVRDGAEADTRKGGGGRRDPEGRDIFVLCLSKKTGEVLWQRKLDEANARYSKQNMSTPSPVTDGRHVWTLTGNGVVTALDMGGQVVWRREIQKDYGSFELDWGYASSPLLFGSKLIVQVLHGTDEKNLSYLLAFEADTGKTAWKVDRPTDAIEEGPDTYASPTLMRAGEKTELIVGGADYITSHDPASGQEIWRCGGLNPTRDRRYRGISSPLVLDGLVLMAIRRGPVVACRGGGSGNVTETHTAWTSPAAADVPSMVGGGGCVYVLHDSGMLTCLDARTGQPHYLKTRLPGGAYSASPLLADGRVYVISEDGHTTVLAAGPEFKILGENKLDDDQSLASIAVAGRELFIRTGRHLYCISEAAGR